MATNWKSNILLGYLTTKPFYWNWPL